MSPDLTMEKLTSIMEQFVQYVHGIRYTLQFHNQISVRFLYPDLSTLPCSLIPSPTYIVQHL